MYASIPFAFLYFKFFLNSKYVIQENRSVCRQLLGAFFKSWT